MNDIAAIKQPVLAEFQQFESAFADAFESDNHTLKEVYVYVLNNVGKQVRPLLTLLCSQICGGITDTTIQAGVALELMHTASLLHDDVIDEAEQRRGKPSVHSRWGNKAAILSGDYLLASSFLVSTTINHPQIWRILASVGKQLAVGELLQQDSTITVENQWSEANYFDVINNKTAQLFAACCQIGALGANAPKTQVLAMKEFGQNIGLIFQIKDDIFDYFDSAEIGKPTGNDLKEGKITLPLLHALSQVSEDESNAMMNNIRKVFLEHNESLIPTIQKFARSNGGIRYAEEQMDLFHQKALDALSIFEESKEKASLLATLQFVSDRTY
ncbi:polyprenyl synthetase family protein [Microbacter margulisiae]|uniref:Octaprenyl-diphosphate synthase n=1 Tax=Microbacter margulisiae TaxID=1350067 RepID=A0A7W5H274_9PORP|nr:polyprenyl synthetase family protein [Microbacter margulisiae]MBB3187339.1 octaprenyl-diphosphate synthase [Microbacter margulisiae]